MANQLLLFMLINFFCAKNALAQIVPYANGFFQRPFSNQNQIINVQQPIPSNYIQNTPISLPTQRPANELTIISNLPVINKAPNNVQIISQINRLPAYNLGPVNRPPNLNNIPNVNQLNIQPYNNMPIGTNLPIALISSLPLNNNQVIRNNIQPVNQYNYLPNNNPSLPIISQLNNLPFNNLPIGASIVSQLQLPIANNLPLSNMPNINTLPIPNPQPINRVLFNNMPVTNLPLLNNVPSYNTIPIVNNNIPFSNTQPINANLILSNMPIAANLPIRNNLPAFSNQPSNILSNPYQNLNSLAVINALTNSINPNLANGNFLGNNNVVIGQPNNIVSSLPIANNPQYIRNIPSPQSIQNLPVANECGCRNSALSTQVEKEFGNSLNEAVSLNGLQLGGLGGMGILPLYKGLPVIGMTESVVNLDSCNCQN